MAVTLPSWAAEVQKTHMSEELRSSISRVVILPTDGESGKSTTGTYGKRTDGVMGGMAKGSEIGRIPVEVGHVPINIPIPILRELGMIAGAITGGAERHIQNLRDRMVDDMSREIEQPLSNSALATDVFWGLHSAASVEPKLFAVTTPIPEGTDAVLYVHLNSISLNVQKNEAIIQTSAIARLTKQSDGTTLYRKEVKYEDRDKLKNWGKNDFVLWREYREFARHYLARELAAELYERVALNHELAPIPTRNVSRDKKDPWKASTKVLSPTLAWEFALLGDDASVSDGAQVLWDVEIYDAQRPVYQAKQVPGTEHTVDVPLEACKTYRWTVRPSYHREGGRVKGAWMRVEAGAAANNGNVGRAISEAHAYIQDFASLDVDCRSK